MAMRIHSIVTIALIICLCGVNACCARAAEGGELRKQLFLIERQLARVENPVTVADVLKLDVNNVPLSADEIKATMDQMIADSNAEENKDNSKNSNKDDESPKEFGSVSAKLGGGSLTSYSYSSTGLDLSDALGGGMVLFLQSNEIDVSDLKSDDNIADKFAASSIDKLYGLEGYEDMQNMFQKQAPGKDYTMTGFGATMEIGGYSMSMINYSKPPQKKMKVFFGNDSTGPYLLGVTGVVPGSETVRMNGSKLTKGTHYEFNYNRGEITFTEPLGLNQKVAVEYEVAESGGGGPGKFTGVRFEKPAKDETADNADNNNNQTTEGESRTQPNAETSNRPFRPSLLSWGVSYMKEDKSTFQQDGNSVRNGFRSQTLLGIDGAIAVGDSTEVTFEYANSNGDKSRDTGRFASATFTIADTRASDDNPEGPYYLASGTLPIIENTDEVRVNGILLERNTDYTLDPTYGFLRIKKKDLDLGPRDVINVVYHYTTEDERYGDTGTAKSDSAYKMTMKNTFGGFTHSIDISRFGADFTQLGGASTNQLLNRNQTFGWSGKGLDITHTRGLTRNLRDSTTGLTETGETQSTSFGYKFKKRATFSYKTDESTRLDNLTTHQTDTAQKNTNWQLDLTPGDKYKIGINSATSENNVAGTSSSSETTEKQVVTFSAKPMRVFSFDTTQTSGRTTQQTPGETRTRDQDSASYKAQYKPSKKMNFTYDLSTNDFSGAAQDTSVPASATGPAQATDTFAADPATGNRTSNLSITLNPTNKLKLSARLQKKDESAVSGARTTRQNNYDTTYKFNDKTQLQYRLNTMNGSRSTMMQDTSMQSMTLTTRLNILPRGADITLKRENQNSGVTTISQTTTTETSLQSRTMGVTLSAEPIWEGKKLKLEWRGKSGDNITNGASTQEKETRRALDIDIPFIKDSAFQISWNETKFSGSRTTCRSELGLTLSGQLTALFDLQLSYKTQTFTDQTNPEASNNASDLNIVIKGQREW